MMKKGGGDGGHGRPAAMSALLLLTLALAACGGAAEEEVVVAADEPTGCPQIRIVGDAAEVVQFREGPGRDLTDVVARGAIADYAGSCEYDDDSVTVDLGLTIGAEKGPAATVDRAQFAYFVAVADPASAILAKEVFTTEVLFENGTTRAGIVEELAPVIPLSSLAEGRFYQILVGFQVTPDQLDYNRR